jgi:hypothetical protein
MTGAIAFVLALPALVDSAHERATGLRTPPSSLRRAVHVPVQFAPTTRPVRAERLVAAHPTRRPATQPAVVRTTAHPDAILAPRGRPHEASTGRTASPPPPPAAPAQTEPETRELASAPPPAAAPTPAPASPAPAIPEPSSDKVKGKGRGKAKGHDKTNAESTPETTVPQAGTTAAPPASPAPAEPEDVPAAAEPQDHGQGHGKDKQHGHTD